LTCSVQKHMHSAAISKSCLYKSNISAM
jgi:hypothetical protein